MDELFHSSTLGILWPNTKTEPLLVVDELFQCPILIIVVGSILLYSRSQPNNIEIGESKVSEVVSKNGTFSFMSGSKVDFENYGSPSTELAVVFSSKGNKSGIANGGCAPGQSFLEITETDGLMNKELYSESWNNSKEYIGSEVFANKQFDVFNSKFDDSDTVRYYVSYTPRSSVEIAYRPTASCVNGINYKSDLISLLESLTF